MWQGTGKEDMDSGLGLCTMIVIQSQLLLQCQHAKYVIVGMVQNLDSGLWTGLCTGLWTELWTQFWTRLDSS